MSTHNIGFNEISKIITKLSSNTRLISSTVTWTHEILEIETRDSTIQYRNQT